VTEINDLQIEEALKLVTNLGYQIVKPEDKKKKIRLVFYGDSPTVATGFGTVSRNILLGLYNTGMYDIQVFGVNYMGLPHNFPFNIYPMILNNEKDPYGRKYFETLLPQLDFDILLMNQDTFIIKDFLSKAIIESNNRGKRFKSIVYFPVDGKPKPDWIEAMNLCDQPVTYTKWAQKQCINVFPAIESKLDYVYHGVNMENFFPYPDEVRVQLRKKYYGKNAEKFIILNLNRNQPRKDIPRSIAAFKEFKKDYPNSILYLHMAVLDFGWHLAEVCKAFDLQIGEDVLFPNPETFTTQSGFPIHVVNELYNCADVCISTTLGEGVGLSLLEAMASRTPFIGPNNTALTELLDEGRGYLAECYNNRSMFVILSNDNEVIRPLTDIYSLVKLLKRVYDNPDKAKVTAERAFKWVKENLSWEKNIVPVFHNHILRLYDDLQKSNVILPPAPGPAIITPSDWKKGEVL
jgi:glycosyltransferase involved in cell wall biosynthesis